MSAESSTVDSKRSKKCRPIAFKCVAILIAVILLIALGFLIRHLVVDLNGNSSFQDMELMIGMSKKFPKQVYFNNVEGYSAQEIKNNVAKCLAEGSDFQVITDKDLQAFMNETYHQSTSVGYAHHNERTKRQIEASLFMYSKGGFYFQDFIPCASKQFDHRELDSLRLVVWTHRSAEFCNSMLATVPRHPVLLEAVEELIASGQKNDLLYEKAQKYKGTKVKRI